MPHFEIHVSDVAKAKQFYGGLFNWTFESMPVDDDIEYHLISGKHIGQTAGLTGGLMSRMGQPPESGSPIRGGTMTFEVTDCDERYKWALDNGGAEALPPQDYQGIGRCAYVEDGQGNVVGMIAPAVEGN